MPRRSDPARPFPRRPRGRHRGQQDRRALAPQVATVLICVVTLSYVAYRLVTGPS